MKNQSKDKWLVCKHYLHIDLPFTTKEEARIKAYVTSPEKIARHPFLPLIRRVVKTYPFRRNENGKRERNVKKRNLTFASHIDAAIYGYYAQDLQAHYEKLLKEYHIEQIPTAYRKIPKDEHSKHNKCNIDFASEVFSYIKDHLSATAPLAVITFDIKGFFDNLDHKILKHAWCKSLGEEHMPDDIYAVYKSVTRYSYVMEDQLFKLFSGRIKCKRKDGHIVERKIKHRRYLRDKNAIAFCCARDIKEIREKHLINIRKANDNKGIPQGLLISATLANVYMLDFDTKVSEYVSEKDGIYRRYSDDMIVVCPLEKGTQIKEWIINKITDINLQIEEHKTNLYRFTIQNGNPLCEHIGKTQNDLEYLGFSFDGRRILLKNASIGKFYAKMYRSIDRAKYYAYHINNKTRGKIFKHRLITKYTKAGQQPRLPWIKDKRTGKLKHPKGIKSWGNYLSYVRKASISMNCKEIERQLRKSSHKLAKLMRLAEKDVSDSIYKNRVRQLYTYGKVYW